MKEKKEVDHANNNLKKTGVTILISHRGFLLPGILSHIITNVPIYYDSMGSKMFKHLILEFHYS